MLWLTLPRPTCPTRLSCVTSPTCPVKPTCHPPAHRPTGFLRRRRPFHQLRRASRTVAVPPRSRPAPQLRVRRCGARVSRGADDRPRLRDGLLGRGDDQEPSRVDGAGPRRRAANPRTARIDRRRRASPAARPSASAPTCAPSRRSTARATSAHATSPTSRRCGSCTPPIRMMWTRPRSTRLALLGSSHDGRDEATYLRAAEVARASVRRASRSSGPRALPHSLLRRPRARAPGAAGGAALLHDRAGGAARAAHDLAHLSRGRHVGRGRGGQRAGDARRGRSREERRPDARQLRPREHVADVRLPAAGPSRRGAWCARRLPRVGNWRQRPGRARARAGSARSRQHPGRLVHPDVEPLRHRHRSVEHAARAGRSAARRSRRRGRHARVRARARGVRT